MTPDSEVVTGNRRLSGLSFLFGLERRMIFLTLVLNMLWFVNVCCWVKEDYHSVIYVLVILALVLIIRHKYVCIFILWLMSLPACNGNHGFNKVWLSWAQQSVNVLLVPSATAAMRGTCMQSRRSGCNTRFTLYNRTGHRSKTCRK